jgi:hypothetical protein
MGFGTEEVVTQDWTDEPDAIVAGLGKVPDGYYGTSGTAIYQR